MAIVMLIICPLVVLIESSFSHELSYIKNTMCYETAWGYIQMMHAVAPVMSMTVQCYHPETRTRVVYYKDANGHTKSRTETYEEPFVKFVETDAFRFGCWVDVSKREMPTINSMGLTRLKIYDHVIFGDQETKEDFNRQRREILDRNRYRDYGMNFSVNRRIPGFEKRIFAYVDLSAKPWWIGEGYYWLATLLMLTWPYRWLFRGKIAVSHYDLKKKMYKSTTPPMEVDVLDSSPQQASYMVPVVDAHVNPSFSMSEIPGPEQRTQRCPTPPPPYPGMRESDDPAAVEGSPPPPTYQDAVDHSANQGPDSRINTQQIAPSTPPPSYDEVVHRQPGYSQAPTSISMA